MSANWFSGNKNQASDPNRAGQYGFDLAGNNTGLSGAAIVYDGDGHQVRFMKSGTDAFYAYDGEGRRVRAAVNSQTPSVYVHDAAGELAAEYGGAAGAQAGVVYVFGDHLGSTRLTVDDRGAVSAFDYLPYGEALVVGRTAAQGYADPANWLKVKFTGKERDSDSGLDYFGARYLSGAQGRWTTPDWSATAEPVPYSKLENPQSLNLYSYVYNNPLSQADADGHWPTPRYGGSWTHSDIVDAAYPGMSAAQRQIIKDGSARADNDQRRAGSPAHGMTPMGGRRDQAMADAARIVNDSESAARSDQAAFTAAGGRGISNDALNALTPAFHEQTDETSPSHAGFQEWRGYREGTLKEQAKEYSSGFSHASRESSATPAERAASIEAARRVLRSVLPEDLYQQAITPPKK